MNELFICIMNFLHNEHERGRDGYGGWKWNGGDGMEDDGVHGCGR